MFWYCGEDLDGYETRVPHVQQNLQQKMQQNMQQKMQAENATEHKAGPFRLGCEIMEPPQLGR